MENNFLLIDKNKVHDHNTRILNNIHVERRKLKLVDKCPIRAGSLLYNKLSTRIKNQRNVNFKNVLKQYLLGKCFYNVTEYCKDKDDSSNIM